MPRTGVYCIRNLANGKVYIGSSSRNLDKRQAGHRRALELRSHQNVHLQRAWCRYGSKSFVFVTLELCHPDLCLVREQSWIDYYDSASQDHGYNICPFACSTRGRPCTEEVKQKLRELNGSMLASQARLAARIRWDAYRKDPPTRRIYRVQKPSLHARVLPIDPQTGRKMATDQFRNIMSLAAKKRFSNPDELQRLRETARRPATIRKRSEAAKAAWAKRKASDEFSRSSVMPSQKAKSALVDRYGDKLRKAWDKHKNDETDFGGGGGLPAGIEGGIAQIVQCGFQPVKDGKPNAGELYFICRAAVKSPKEHEGKRVAGRFTQKIEPLYDTPNRTRSSFEEHIAWVSNFFRTLGITTGDTEAEDLEDLAASVEESAPCVGFRTWKGDKQTDGPYANREPRVQEVWEGLVEYDEDTDESTGVEYSDQHSSGAENGQTGRQPQARTARPAAPSQSVPARTAPNKGGTTPPARKTPTEETQTDEFADLDSLVERADQPNDDEEAQNALREMAHEAGITEDQVNDAASWREVADLITGSTPEEEGTAEEEEGTGEEEEEGAEEGTTQEPEGREDPKVRMPVRYHPVDPKTKKPQRRPVECVVTAVYGKAKTADLKSLDNPKNVYKAVKWDALEYK